MIGRRGFQGGTSVLERCFDYPSRTHTPPEACGCADECVALCPIPPSCSPFLPFSITTPTHLNTYTQVSGDEITSMRTTTEAAQVDLYVKDKARV